MNPLFETQTCTLFTQSCISLSTAETDGGRTAVRKALRQRDRQTDTDREKTERGGETKADSDREG